MNFNVETHLSIARCRSQTSDGAACGTTSASSSYRAAAVAVEGDQGALHLPSALTGSALWR